MFIPGGAFEKVALYWFEFQTGTTELKRLKSGFLLKDILDRFKNKTLSLLPDQLMQIYSGHDSTIASLLNTLNIFEVLLQIFRFKNRLNYCRTTFFYSFIFHLMHPVLCLNYTNLAIANMFNYFIGIRLQIT